MIRYYRLFLTALVACALTACADANGDSAATLEKDLDTIMAWWHGDYDNDRQLARLMSEGEPIWRADDSGAGGHIEVASHYRRVDLPAFGNHVLYVEETKHGDPANIFRQRIYTLDIDDDTSSIRVKLWYFNDKEKYVGAWEDLDRLGDLAPDAMFALQDECDLIVKRDGERYHMAMMEKACVFGDNYFNYQVLLGADSFWFRDKIVRVEDDVVVSTAGDFTYHELDKE